MTGIYIATKTQADYDALMRLAEAAGYKWSTETPIPEMNIFEIYENRTVIKLEDNKSISYSSKEYFESEGATIETIPNLADIVAIYTTKKLDWENYVKTKSISIPEGIYQSCVFELNDGNVWGSNRNYCKVLAVEYKPKESEVMPEKVKLPKFLCDQISTLKGSLSIEKISGPKEAVEFMNRLKKMYGKANVWLRDSRDNQWKLIDALRNGYEPEPEQLYYVRFAGNNGDFLNFNTETKRTSTANRKEVFEYKTKFTMHEIIAIDPRYKAFAVPVEGVDGNE